MDTNTLRPDARSADPNFDIQGNSVFSLTGVSDDFEQDFTKNENEERGNWTGRLDFVLSCLGYAVGLGNVWRFPYLCYQNGGAVFFIPYFIMLFFVGMPLFLLELSLGQFSSMGPLTCWQMAPVFKGIGVAMCFVSAYIACYYNVIMSWAIFYIFASFTNDLPWANCDREWATYFCKDYLSEISEEDCIPDNNFIALEGVCYNVTGPRVDRYGSFHPNEPYGIYNQTMASEKKFKPRLPAEEYLNGYVLGFSYSTGYGDLGQLQPKLLGSLMISWTITALCLSKGIKSSGRVVYFTALFPYAMLFVLLIRGLTLEGFSKGLYFYVADVKWDKLLDARVWKDAAGQIFFSLSTSMGGLVALSSYNRFHHDMFRDALMVTMGNCFTSIFAGFTIFSFIGYFATRENVPVDEVVESGVTLAFVIYPSAVAEMPGAPIWSIIFFLMLVTLGLDSVFAMVETISTAFIDQFAFLKKHKTFAILAICFTGFSLGLPMITQGGLYVFALFDHYGGGWNLLLNGLFETICIAWVYGFYNFRNDIYIMIGKKPSGKHFLRSSWWWKAMWGGGTEFVITFVLFFSLYDYSEPTVGDYEYPANGAILGWCITMSVVLCHVITPFVMMSYYKNKLRKGYLGPFKPTRAWGPYLPQHRKMMSLYRDPESFDINPYKVEMAEKTPSVNTGPFLTIPGESEIIGEEYDVGGEEPVVTEYGEQPPVADEQESAFEESQADCREPTVVKKARKGDGNAGKGTKKTKSMTTVKTAKGSYTTLHTAAVSSNSSLKTAASNT